MSAVTDLETNAATSAVTKPAGSPSNPPAGLPANSPARSLASAPTAPTGSRWTVLPATAACVIAGLAFHRLFAWSDLLPVVLIAAVLPAVAAAGPVVLRKPPALWLSAVATVVLWILTMSATLFRTQAVASALPSPTVLHAIVLGLHDGWRTMLTTVPPLPGHAETLVTVSAATWLASYATVETTLRTRKISVILIPALTLFGLALALDAGAPGSNLLVGVCFLAVCGATILLRGGRLGHGAGRRALAASGTAAAITALAALVAPQLPGLADSRPFSLRSKVTPPPPHLQKAISPLDEIPVWLQNPDTELFTIRSAQPQNTRLAVFDTFDGITWTSSDRFVPTGGRVPADSDVATAPTQRHSQQVTVAALTGPWLPAADRPTAVTGIPALVDAASGALLTTDTLHSGVTYRVDSATPQPADAQLRSAAAATDSQAAAALDLPTTDAAGQELDAYDDLKQLAQQATAGADSPFQQAAMLERYLQKNESVDVTAIPGHTYRSLQFFLDTTHRGTSEQFATAFAVLARTLALPTRVVVGFKPGVEQDGVWHVRSGDVLAWPEVRFAGIGWVPFYPTPDQQSASSAQDKPPAGAGEDRQKLDQQAADQAAQPIPADDPVPAAASTQQQTGSTGSVLVPVIAVSCAAVLFGYLVLVLAAPPMRRARRKRRPDPNERVLGAWHQAVVCVRPLIAARPAFSSLTALEIAALGADRLGPETGPGFVTLAGIVDFTRFAGRQASAETADEAWRLCRGLERAAARTVPLWRRSLRRLHPRMVWRA